MFPVCVALCLSQLSRSTEEMGRWRRSRGTYSRMTAVMMFLQTEGNFFVCVFMFNWIRIAGNDRISFLNHVLFLTDTTDPQRDVTCLCHLLGRTYSMMCNRQKECSSKLLLEVDLNAYLSPKGSLKISIIQHVGNEEEDYLSDKWRYDQKIGENRISQVNIFAVFL